MKEELSTSVIDRLNEEYFSRLSKNPSYSKRSFAKRIGIDQSMLGKLMSGKLKPSEKMTEYLQSVLRLASSDSTGKPSRYSLLPGKILETLLSDLKFFTVMELAKTKSFEGSLKYISQRIDTSERHVQMLLENMQKINLAKKRKNKWEISPNNFCWTQFEQTTNVKKEYQKRVLEKAIESIDTVAFEERENANLVFAIPQDKVTLLKRVIDEFLDKVNNISVAEDESDEVYQLAVALYPVTQRRKNNE